MSNSAEDAKRLNLLFEITELTKASMDAGLINPAQATAVFGRIHDPVATSGGNYDQTKGDYTQKGGGSHNQGEGGYNQSKSITIDTLIRTRDDLTKVRDGALSADKLKDIL